MNTSEFDQFADEYEQLHAKNIAITGEKPEYFHEYKLKRLEDFVRTSKVQVNEVLDFGSGIGNSTPFLKRHFPHANLTSADVSKRSLEIAESRFPGTFRSLGIEQNRIPAPDNFFDVIFCACVFHHIPHEEHVHWLGELHRVARPGALLTIFEHNPLNPLTVRAVNTCPFDENAHLIPANQFAEAYRQSGWRTPKTRFHVFFPRALSTFRFLEPHLAAIPFGGQYSITAIK